MAQQGSISDAALMGVPTKLWKEEFVSRMVPRGSDAALMGVHPMPRKEEFVTDIAWEVSTILTLQPNADVNCHSTPSNNWLWRRGGNEKLDLEVLSHSKELCIQKMQLGMYTPICYGWSMHDTWERRWSGEALRVVPVEQCSFKGCTN